MDKCGNCGQALPRSARIDWIGKLIHGDLPAADELRLSTKEFSNMVRVTKLDPHLISVYVLESSRVIDSVDDVRVFVNEVELIPWASVDSHAEHLRIMGSGKR